MKSVTTNRYYKDDAEHIKKNIQYYIKFINENIKSLVRKNQTTFLSLEEGFKLEGKLTDKQYNLLENIYEKIMKEKGLPAVDVHHDLKKGVKY